MSEKSAFTKPISAAIEKATGVFHRPKLQRRAYTAHAANELISAVRLSNVVFDLKTPQNQAVKQHELPTEENNNQLITFSPCLTTGTENGSFLANSLPNGAGQSDQERTRRNSDTNMDTVNHFNRSVITKNQLKNDFSTQCLKVKEIIKETLKTQLSSIEYSHRECGEKGRIISQLIEKSVKSQCDAIYKVTALVYIGAVRDYGIQLACQCSWSPGVDFFAMETYKTPTIFASGIVFATIYE